MPSHVWTIRQGPGHACCGLWPVMTSLPSFLESDPQACIIQDSWARPRAAEISQLHLCTSEGAWHSCRPNASHHQRLVHVFARVQAYPGYVGIGRFGQRQGCSFSGQLAAYRNVPYVCPRAYRRKPVHCASAGDQPGWCKMSRDRKRAALAWPRLFVCN